MAGIYYSIKRNRLKSSLLQGMELGDNDTVILSENSERHLYLVGIDSATDNATWGRLSFDCDITEDMVLYVYVVALNEDMVSTPEGYVSLEKILCDGNVPDSEKKRLLKGANAKRIVDKNDVLLYDLEGQHLYVCIDVMGEGEGTLSNIRIDRRGDNYMDTFPSIYRERGGFFHRFLSVFSSIYNDFEEEIDALPAILDCDKADESLLEVYAGWLGLDLTGDYLTVEMMRNLVKEGYKLNRMKGTRACLERVIEIVLGERAIILEQNTIRSFVEDGELMDNSMESSSIYDVNILIKKRLSENDRHQLLHLLRQFVPLRSRLHLIRLKDSGVLDTDVYLDLNAVLSTESYGVLDDDMEMDDEVILE